MNEIIFIIIAVSALGIFALPKRSQYYLMLGTQIFLAALTGYLMYLSFNRIEPLQIYLFDLLGNDVSLVIDSLSAFFIFVINITVLTGALYAKGYLKPYLRDKTRLEMAWHYFNFLILHISLLMVAMLREGISFLVFWELMSVSVFFLIIFESEKQENKEAGIKFLIQMHVAFYFIIAAFIICSIATGQNIGFESLEQYFKDYPAFPVFLLFFIGFGIKAGFIPLHTWLIHAHPAAPSHISGIMSGVIIKMGIYGIVRVLTYIHSDLMPIGVFILIISIISGIFGVTIAIVQHDYKKLLAYHSIENIGIIGIGIGIGVMGLAINNPVLASLGFAGGLLHVLNHALFKSLLFYAAGSIYQQTHTRNIENLGGLMKKMPSTAVFFLLGAAAISGLPPFNGFISEFLIYTSLFKSLMVSDSILSVTLLAGIVALAVIGGLAVFCFTKVFSIIFLGTARSDKTRHSHEVRSSMLFPKFIIAILIIMIGIMPFMMLRPMSFVAGVFVDDTSSLRDMTGTMSGISLSLSLLIVFIGILFFIKLKLSKVRHTDIGSTWGCAYTGSDPALHQYSATSYAEYIIMKAKILVGVKKHFRYLTKENIFPGESYFKTGSSDVFEDNLVSRPAGGLLSFMEKIAVFQTGNIQHYLLYAIVFVIVISIISIFGII
ncbi:TPA: hypothetical protein DCR49_01635 [Candidatus Delongbacteria bacterium]|nr:hypothetical protein [Candidatus Delongbacteria bacterium]